MVNNFFMCLFPMAILIHEPQARCSFRDYWVRGSILTFKTINLMYLHKQSNELL